MIAMILLMVAANARRCGDDTPRGPSQVTLGKEGLFQRMKIVLFANIVEDGKRFAVILQEFHNLG